MGIFQAKVGNFENGWERLWEFQDFGWEFLCFGSSHTGYGVPYKPHWVYRRCSDVDLVNVRENTECLQTGKEQFSLSYLLQLDRTMQEQPELETSLKTKTFS